MKDIYADTLSERLAKKLPGWVRAGFDRAVGGETIYPLAGLQQKRGWWRERNEAYVLHGTKDFETWSPPQFTVQRLSDGFVYTPTLKKPEIFEPLSFVDPWEFMSAVQLGIDFLPRSAHILLGEQGVDLKVAITMTDINPRYAEIRCRGLSGVVANVSGIFNPLAGFAAVTKGYISQVTGKFVDDTHGALDGVLHEYAHGLEDMLFNINNELVYLFEAEPHQRDFFRAYRQDVAELNGAIKTEDGVFLSYYLTKENGGTQETEGAACSETFAQLFAEKYADMQISLQRAFPHTAQVLNRIIKSLDALIARDPSFAQIKTPLIEMQSAVSHPA